MMKEHGWTRFRGGKGGSVVVAVICVLIPVPALADQPPGAIRWRSAAALRPATQSPAQLGEALRQLAPADGVRHIVVSFDQGVDDGQRRSLSEWGLTLLSPLGDRSFFGAISAKRLNVTRAVAVPSLRTVSGIEREFKLHPMLLGGQAPAHAVIGRVAAGKDDPADVVAVYVLFHPDVLLNDGVTGSVAHGATVKSELSVVNGLVLELPRASIDALADEDGVQWIEPALPPLEAQNLENRILTQVNALQAAPYDLNGGGVNVMIYDAGAVMATHVDFGGRVYRRDASGISSHSTHVAGTIGGDGSANGGLQRGMAPAVTIQSFGLQWDGSLDPLYTDPGDMQNDCDAAINVLGAQLANMSIGTNVESNGFDCAWQGDYGITDALMDAIVHGSLGRSFPIIKAAGNERQSSRCDVEGFGDYYSISPPGANKNSIVVGAVNSDNDSMTTFSGWGPTDDGRLKPDISAPGCQNGGDFGVTSCGTFDNMSYVSMCGTSMAAPTVTGICALILQDFRAQFPSLSDPLSSTLKILLAHAAVDRGNVGPDYQFGYGSVRAKDTIDFMRTGSFAESAVGQSGVVRYWLPIDPGTPSLKITLAWDDVPGTPNVNPALINDLDLVVFEPTSTQHYPWTLSPLNPSAPAVRTQADHLNNMEQVVVSAPSVGVWSVEVRGFAVPQGPQSFSVCASPRLVKTPLVITFPNGTPQYINPGQSATFDVRVESVGENYVPGSVTLHYRFDGGAYQTAALSALGGDLFQATLPATNCSASPRFYVSAQGSGGTMVSNPATAPTSVLTATVGSLTTPFADNFQTDQGWTVSGDVADPLSGQWQRGVPVNGNRGDPATDADGSGQCYVTGNIAGNSDVDGGSTILTSPAMDLSNGATLSYRYWLSDIMSGAIGPEDSMTVAVATDAAGTNWQSLRTYSTAVASWRTDSIAVGTEVAATTTVRIRFTATDNTPGDVIEGGVDAVQATSLECHDALLLGDLNNDGRVDDADVPLFAAVMLGDVQGTTEGVNLFLADMNGDGMLDGRDIQLFVAALLAN